MRNSPRNWFRCSVVCAAAIALIPLATSPAYGAGLAIPDATGDMWRQPRGELVPAPDNEIGDVTRTAVWFTDRRLVIRVRFVELTRTGREFFLTTRMRAADGRRYNVDVVATRRERRGWAELWRHLGDMVDCNVSHRIDYADNAIRLSFPLRCIGDPRSLRFGVDVGVLMRGGWHLDNGLTEQYSEGGWTEPVRRG